MNDRFRFRICDNVAQNYIGNNFRSITEYMLNKDGVLFEVEQGLSDSTFILEKEDCVIEQCTGLKDNNGKLIYEGDLVKLPVNCNKELHGVYTTQEVVWRNGFWLLSYVSSQKGLIIPRGYSAGFLHDYLDEDFNEDFLFGNNDMFCKYKQLEVIGNIHENPELLEGKWI